MYALFSTSHSSCTISWFDPASCSSKDQVFLSELHLHRGSILKEMWTCRFIPHLWLNLTYQHPHHVFRLKRKKKPNSNLPLGNFLLFPQSSFIHNSWLPARAVSDQQVSALSENTLNQSWGRQHWRTCREPGWLQSSLTDRQSSLIYS